jgi:murein DD-endopeptidase MepM/ murein hydrolase activator NlpD
MQIILVSGARKRPRTVDLGARRWRLRLAGIATLAVLTFLGVGAALALVVASPRERAVQQIRVLRQQVHTQHQQLAQVRDQARQDVNALAVKLGQLDAQSVRLDALGMRLARAGKLDPKEFDFNQPPAVGGPESEAEGSYSLPPSLNAGISALATRFSTQQAQLRALQDLLLDRNVASKLRPTGMPVAGGYISSYFGERVDPINGHRAFHPGLDIAVPLGTPVHAVAEGIVTYAGVRSGYGNVVEIDHGDGYMTRYAHNHKVLVHPGEHVRVGQVIADAGSTGRSTGAHVHFEVWYKGRVVNPTAYVRSHR